MRQAGHCVNLDRYPFRADRTHIAPVPGTRGVAPYRIYDTGNQRPVELLRYIEVLEQCLGKNAIMQMLPLQAGDEPDTEAGCVGPDRRRRLSAQGDGGGRRWRVCELVRGYNQELE